MLYVLYVIDVTFHWNSFSFYICAESPHRCTRQLLTWQYLRRLQRLSCHLFVV